MKKNNPSKKLTVEDKLILQLYVSGMSLKSMDAIRNLHKVCEEYLKGKYELEIIDIYKHPEQAAAHQIVFSPSLIKWSPLPKKLFIGDFSDTEKVIRGLGIAASH